MPWTLDGVEVEPLLNEKRTFKQLEIKTLAESSEIASLRALNQGAGKFEVITAEDGSFTTQDKSSGDNIVSADPPIERKPPRQQNQYHLDEYEERLRGQQVQTYEVTFTLQAPENKSSVSQPTPTAGPDEWLFEFSDGNIVTRRVRTNIRSGRTTLQRSYDFQLVVTKEEAVTVEGSLNRLAAVTVENIPDGSDIADDNTSTNRNTLKITGPSNMSPSEQPIDDGEYVVESYETSLISDAFYGVSLSIHKD